MLRSLWLAVLFALVLDLACSAPPRPAGTGAGAIPTAAPVACTLRR